MEELSLKYGVGGICVMLTAMVLVRVAEFVWRIQQKKERLTETSVKELTESVRQSTVEMKLLSQRVLHLETTLHEVGKLKTDLNRFYCAIKAVAGEKWPAIREELMKEGRVS